MLGSLARFSSANKNIDSEQMAQISHMQNRMTSCQRTASSQFVTTILVCMERGKQTESRDIMANPRVNNIHALSHHTDTAAYTTIIVVMDYVKHRPLKQGTLTIATNRRASAITMVRHIFIDAYARR